MLAPHSFAWATMSGVIHAGDGSDCRPNSCIPRSVTGAPFACTIWLPAVCSGPTTGGAPGSDDATIDGDSTRVCWPRSDEDHATTPSAAVAVPGGAMPMAPWSWIHDPGEVCDPWPPTWVMRLPAAS